MLGKWLKLRDARRNSRRNKSTSRVPCPDSRRQRAVPSLEPLEDRVVPVLFFAADAQLLSITHSPAQAVAGTAETFAVRVRNNGPMALHGVSLQGQFSQPLSGLTTTPSSGTFDAATGSWSGLSLKPGAIATLTVRGTLPSTDSGTLSTTITLRPFPGVFDPNPANNSLTDRLGTIAARADLSVTISDNAGAGHKAIPGTGGAYTVVVTNAGPSAVIGAAVADVMPAGISSDSWTAVASGGARVAATSGTRSIATTVNLLPGAHVTFTILATVSPSATGTLANTATVTAPAGVTDPNAANNSATDTLTLTPTADLRITKTDNSPTGKAVPGGQGQYTVVVSNAGPSAVSGAAVADTLPAAISSASWTATASSGASVAAASGTGSIATTVDLAPGASVTFTITATVSPSATGTLVNTATVTAPQGATDPDTTNNSATDTLTLTPTADLSVTKSDDQGSGHTAVPGGPVTYTVVVSNAGPSNVAGANVSDLIPSDIKAGSWSWTGVASSGASITGASSGTGNVATTVDLASGASVTFTITATIDPGATGTLANTATVTAPQGATDPDTTNNSATDTLTLTPTADLSVTKSDNQGSGHTAVPGTQVVYTVVVSNAGPSAVSGAAVADTLPAAISSASWTANASSGASVTDPSGTGSVATTVNLPPGASVTFTITATIDPAATGTVDNTATVTAPQGATDPDTTNNSATDTLTLTPTADLQVTKTDNTSNHTATAGDTVVYTVVVTNAGASAVRGASVTDDQPAGIQSESWTATASGGASVADPSGTGNIATTVDLPPGASVTFTVTAVIDPNATGSVTNTANVAVPVGVTDPDLANNSAADTITLT
jgi:uncharacterized repeat protein (TIGR01451 family)